MGTLMLAVALFLIVAGYYVFYVGLRAFQDGKMPTFSDGWNCPGKQTQTPQGSKATVGVPPTLATPIPIPQANLQPIAVPQGEQGVYLPQPEPSPLAGLQGGISNFGRTVNKTIGGITEWLRQQLRKLRGLVVQPRTPPPIPFLT